MFRSPIAVAAWYIWLIFAVLNLADLAWQGGGHAGLVAAAVIVLITGVAYVTALRPRVIADEEAVTVHNPLRDIRIPWGAVRDIDLRDSLRLHYEPDRVVHAWAVQSSRRSRLKAQYRAQFRQDQTARRTPGYGRMPQEARSRLTRTTGEIIVSQITDLLNAHRGSPAAGRTAGGGAADGGAPDRGVRAGGAAGGAAGGTAGGGAADGGVAGGAADGGVRAGGAADGDVAGGAAGAGMTGGAADGGVRAGGAAGGGAVDGGVAGGAADGGVRAGGAADGDVTGGAAGAGMTGGAAEGPSATWCWPAVAALALPALLVIIAVLVP